MKTRMSEMKMEKRRWLHALLTVCLLLITGFTSHAAPIQPRPQTMLMPQMQSLPAAALGSLQIAPARLDIGIDGSMEVRFQKEVEKAERNAKEAARAAASQEDQRLLASIIFCEAGNQSYEGQVAVGAVVMNRVKSSIYPDSIEEVIYQPGQFTPAGTGWLDRVRSSGSYTTAAMQAAADALAGVNPVGDCLYFDQGGYGMQIGAHYFH